MTIGVAILTLNAEQHLPHTLPRLIQSEMHPKILVVDSSSTDQTRAIAHSYGVEVLTIKRSEFNHGTTRELARKSLNTDIVVMMTQDAYPVDGSLLDALTLPLRQGQAAISYARQLPHPGTSPLGSFARYYNYPAVSHIRSWEERLQWGVYTVFCSNSCAAYKNEALDCMGGFPRVLFGEDTLVTAHVLQDGGKIAYVAEAAVYHSHDYNLWQEFTRSFDIGMVRRGYTHLSACGTDRKRGATYTRELLKYLRKESPGLIPYALAQTGCKWIGYELGRCSSRAPNWWKRLFSSQPYFWT